MAGLVAHCPRGMRVSAVELWAQKGLSSRTADVGWGGGQAASAENQSAQRRPEV